MSLTKVDLAERIGKKIQKPKGECLEFVEATIKIIKSKLCSGEDVLISGFGKFCIKLKKERKGRNPATGESLMLSAREVVKFKCSDNLRKRIQKKERGLKRNNAKVNRQKLKKEVPLPWGY